MTETQHTNNTEGCDPEGGRTMIDNNIAEVLSLLEVVRTATDEQSRMRHLNRAIERLTLYSLDVERAGIHERSYNVDYELPDGTIVPALLYIILTDEGIVTDLYDRDGDRLLASAYHFCDDLIGHLRPHPEPVTP